LTCAFIVFIVIGGMLYLFIHQMGQFVGNLPQIEENLQSISKNIQQTIASATNLSYEEQNEIIKEKSEDFLKMVESQLTTFLGGFFSIAFSFFLVLVYTFLLLLYRDKFSVFIMMYVPKEKEQKVQAFINKISRVVFQYLWGRSKIMTILGIMYLITFLLFDIPYAILLTIVGALITIIPYIGPFLSAVLPILFSILYGKDLNTILLFSTVVIIIQLIESYYLEPVILGKEVKLNPLIVIIAIIIGGMIWGIAGMILFVPIFAVFRIISNFTEDLRPVGYLFGNTSDPGTLENQKFN
jgi:predicted PurR-regulated permease PerM